MNILNILKLLFYDVRELVKNNKILQIENKTLREQVKIAQETLENRKDLHPELIEYIFCFLK